jgi:hypothetical protein
MSLLSTNVFVGFHFLTDISGSSMCEQAADRRGTTSLVTPPNIHCPTDCACRRQRPQVEVFRLSKLQKLCRNGRLAAKIHLRRNAHAMTFQKIGHGIEPSDCLIFHGRFGDLDNHDFGPLPNREGIANGAPRLTAIFADHDASCAKF